MNKPLIIIIALFCAVFSQGQNPSNQEFFVVDKKISEIPEIQSKTTDDVAKYITTNFITEKLKARAIYVWIATKIDYDAKNMYALNYHQTKEIKADKAFKSKRGISEHFAALFYQLCQKTGVKSYLIEGLTIQNGTPDYIGHAWNVAKIDGKWFMFDPTWGSGGFNGKKFTKGFNDKFFMVKPEDFIKTHMPYDYMWQFLNYPLTAQEFFDGKGISVSKKTSFDFSKTIEEFLKQAPIDQLTNSVQRIEKNGLKNTLITERLNYMNAEIENLKSEAYNSSLIDYNAAVKSYNAFIDYRNKKFKPEKSDADIQKMIDNGLKSCATSQAKLNQIQKPEGQLKINVQTLSKDIKDIEKSLKDQQIWLKNYLSKSPLERKGILMNLGGGIILR